MRKKTPEIILVMCIILEAIVFTFEGNIIHFEENKDYVCVHVRVFVFLCNFYFYVLCKSLLLRQTLSFKISRSDYYFNMLTCSTYNALLQSFHSLNMEWDGYTSQLPVHIVKFYKILLLRY